MAAFLVAEEGLNAGLIIRFEEGDEWIIGRDPDVCYQVLEDPMVSRKHVICRLTSEGYVIENLSVVNPAHLNGKKIEEPLSLQEGDAIQIGSDIFHFTLRNPLLSSEKKGGHPQEGVETPTIYEESDNLGTLAFSSVRDSRWMIKVVAGPNAGAEFGIFENHSFIIGKDPKTCDILFQDLSVSSQHAKIAADNVGNVTIEDLSSLNGTYVNGEKITKITNLHAQDVVALGTTSFLAIDQHQTRETIVSSITGIEGKIYGQAKVQEEKETSKEEEVEKKNWKNMVIPFKHLISAGVFGVFLIVAFGGVFTLFKDKTIVTTHQDETYEISKALTDFPKIEFSFNPSTGKIFILGHVMTKMDHQEMSHLLKSFPFIRSIEDNVIIDELVWENINALLMKNLAWRGVSLTSIIPGHFVLRGYVQTTENAAKLADYVNLNFPYLDKLDNQVVVEGILEAQVQSLLLENGFPNITFQFSNGELILAGQLPPNKQSGFNSTVDTLKKIRGIKTLKNFATINQSANAIIDISPKYKVTGSSKHGKSNQYVVINGKILSAGDSVDGMVITNMQENTIFLEKDGVKYKINYDQ